MPSPSSLLNLCRHLSFEKKEERRQRRSEEDCSLRHPAPTFFLMNRKMLAEREAGCRALEGPLKPLMSDSRLEAVQESLMMVSTFLPSFVCSQQENRREERGPWRAWALEAPTTAHESSLSLTSPGETTHHKRWSPFRGPGPISLLLFTFNKI